MVRSALSKVAWVGRTASMVFGLALVMALLLGVASMALGADGDFFKVGKANVASAVSTLDKSGPGPALRLLVDSGAPLAVNSGAKVAKLNADKVDGHDAPLWVVVNSTGTIARQSGDVLDTSRQGTGVYVVQFDRGVGRCAFGATIYNAPGAQGLIAAENFGTSGDPTDNAVIVETFTPSGSNVDNTFHLMVTC